jgi:hypothetical protein
MKRSRPVESVASGRGRAKLKAIFHIFEQIFIDDKQPQNESLLPFGSEIFRRLTKFPFRLRSLVDFSLFIAFEGERARSKIELAEMKNAEGREEGKGEAITTRRFPSVLLVLNHPSSVRIISESDKKLLFHSVTRMSWANLVMATTTTGQKFN